MITQLTGNGRVLLTLNEYGEWSELFYPYPGQFQHLRELRLGVYDVAKSRFVWLEEGSPYAARTILDKATSTPETHWTCDDFSLVVQDFVHPNHDLIIRALRLKAAEGRAFRLFQYQALNIGEGSYMETAYLDPEEASIVHYKRSWYFEFFSAPKFDAAACGEHTVRGLRGTFVDAEDGTLSGRLISHGAADSALQWNVTGAGDREQVIRSYLALGSKREDIQRIRRYVKEGDPARFERESQAFWGTWVARHPMRSTVGLSDKVRTLYRASVLVMKHVAGANGSIIASPDTRSLVVGGDTYNYCWWRDGGYVAKAMDEAGLYETAHRFLEFAASCQRPDGSFLHRHFPDGAIGSTWHPPPFLQIDQTGTVIAAVWHHFKRRTDLEMLLDLWPMVKQAALFLAQFRDMSTGLPRSSFDLWEERDAIHTYSTAVVIHALERAARIAIELGKNGDPWRQASHEMQEAALRHLWDPEVGRFVRSIAPRDDRLDSSVLLALKLGLVDWADPRARQTVESIEKRLWSRKVGGLARYEGDEYYGKENPWIICTLWLAEAHLLLGERERCRELIEWVAGQALPTGLLPEQLDSETGEARSATPLTWSHSTFVDVVHKYQRSFTGAGMEEE
jgi:alpha,alpha-trehalase